MQVRVGEERKGGKETVLKWADWEKQEEDSNLRVINFNGIQGTRKIHAEA